MALRNTGKPIRSSILHRKMHWPAEQQCRESQVSHTRQVSRDSTLLLGDVIRVPHPPRLLLVHEVSDDEDEDEDEDGDEDEKPKITEVDEEEEEKKEKKKKTVKEVTHEWELTSLWSSRPTARLGS